MKLIVVKCGGSIIDQLTDHFFYSLRELEDRGYSFIFVHGGGPDINDMLEKFEIPVQFEKGLRKTSVKTLEIAEMVLAGKTNRQLVHKLQSKGFQTVGINGSDGFILEADYINKEELGEVGKIKRVNSHLLKSLLSNGLYPVLTPISMSSEGCKLNVNADTVAGAVGAALRADMCIFITDVNGIRNGKQTIEHITESEITQMIEKGTIYGGMIPKVQAALSAKSQGALKILITSGVSGFFADDKWSGTFLDTEERVM